MTRHLRPLLLSAVIAAGAVLGLTPYLTAAAQAAFPGEKGRIAFERPFEGEKDIFSIELDGSDEQRLTENLESSTAPDDVNASYSADGEQIVFESLRDDNEEIYKMDADGSDETRLTFDSESRNAFDGEPAFSPDGSKIVFTRTNDKGAASTDVDIWTMDADGDNPERLLDFDGTDRDPSYSPDGSKVIFEHSSTIYTVDSDGSNPEELTDGNKPDWSPDGSLVVFERSGQIFIIGADGTGERAVLETDTNVPSRGDPVFSPDCTRLAYRRTTQTFVPDGGDEGSFSLNNDIWTSDLDGGNEEQVTYAEGTESNSDWQPEPVDGEVTCEGGGGTDDPQCSDDKDNDNDGKTDFGDGEDNDQGCDDADDNDESDEPADPTIAVTDTGVTEGDSGSTDATFTVWLSAPSSETVTVDFETDDGTATAPDDYSDRDGSLTFEPGDVSKTIVVPVNGDELEEDDETFRLKLSNASNAELADDEGVATIGDDDSSGPPPRPSISITDTGVVEGDSGTTDATFTVSLSSPTTETVTVDYATAEDTATEPEDYSDRSETLTFEPGDVLKTVTVPVNGDELDEDDETFEVKLSNASNAGIADEKGVGTILDDDESDEPTDDPQCSDGDDNDNDGDTDGDDPGCENAADDSESPDPTIPEPGSTECSDGTGENPVKGGVDPVQCREERNRRKKPSPTKKKERGPPVIFLHGLLGSEIRCGSQELWPNIHPTLASVVIPIFPYLIPGVTAPDFDKMRLGNNGFNHYDGGDHCTRTAGPTNLVSTVFGQDVYAGTLKNLKKLDVKSYVYVYDWRKSPLGAVEGLDQLIDRARADTGQQKVTLLAHSMGGIVTRAYIDDPKRAAKVTRALTIGTPYWGSAKAWLPLVRGLESQGLLKLNPLDLLIHNPNSLQRFAQNLGVSPHSSGRAAPT